MYKMIEETVDVVTRPETSVHQKVGTENLNLIGVFYYVFNFKTSSKPNMPIKKKSDFDFILPLGNINNKIGIMDDIPKYSIHKFERESYSVTADHCYARPWNWRPDTSFLRPTKTLFVNKPLPGLRKTSNPLVILQNSDDIIDIESRPQVPSITYDVDKAKVVMKDCETYVLNARPDKNEDYWEEKISK